MTDLQGWQKVAREIGDHHIAGLGLSVLKSGPEHAIGDWLPAEAAAKEILRLRAELVRARERARRFYRADGTFENLASEDEAIQRRIQAAAENAKMRERLHHPCDGCPGCSSNDCPDALAIAQIDLDVWRHEAARLRARVGWLDLLDTEEGRRTYANEALRVELEAARAEIAELRAAQDGKGDADG